MGQKAGSLKQRPLSWADALYLAIVVSFVIAAYAASPYSFIYVTTESIPRGVYVVDQTRKPLLTEIAVVTRPSVASSEHPTVRALLQRSEYRMLKPIGAVEGSFIHSMGSYIWSCPNGAGVSSKCTLLGITVAQDSYGRPLEPFKFEGARLARGQVYLGDMTVHPRSFDSRYFGPVAIDSIVGVAYPLMTW